MPLQIRTGSCLTAVLQPLPVGGILFRKHISLIPYLPESRASTHGDEDLVVEVTRQLVVQNAWPLPVALLASP